MKAEIDGSAELLLERHERVGQAAVEDDHGRIGAEHLPTEDAKVVRRHGERPEPPQRPRRLVGVSLTHGAARAAAARSGGERAGSAARGARRR